MKRNNKKPVIKDDPGTRVLIETIAAYDGNASYRGIKVYLRSGEKINMIWGNRDNKEKAKQRLDSFFDFG